MNELAIPLILYAIFIMLFIISWKLTVIVKILKYLSKEEEE